MTKEKLFSIVEKFREICKSKEVVLLLTKFLISCRLLKDFQNLHIFFQKQQLMHILDLF